MFRCVHWNLYLRVVRVEACNHFNTNNTSQQICVSSILILCHFRFWRHIIILWFPLIHFAWLSRKIFKILLQKGNSNGLCEKTEGWPSDKAPASIGIVGSSESLWEAEASSSRNLRPTRYPAHRLPMLGYALFKLFMQVHCAQWVRVWAALFTSKPPFARIEP